MKNLLLLAFSLFLFTACTKTKTQTVYVNKTITDTVKINNNISLLGKWSTNQVDYLNPVFTKDSLQWGLNLPYKYAASADTIYRIYSNNTFFAENAYQLSATGDTLTLTYFYQNVVTLVVYTRVN